jgi:hypothetical protein
LQKPLKIGVGERLQRKLGVLYVTLTRPDYKKAIPLLEQAGTEGDSESWVNLGIVYLKYHEDQLLRPMKNLSQDGNVYNGEGELYPKEEFFYLESDTQEAIILKKAVKVV